MIEKNKKVIIILSIIILIIILLIKHNNLSPSQNINLVELRESGFYPDPIQIRKDEEVRFVNKTSEPFWPASDPHPSHTIYQGFDSKMPIAPNESWSFKFEKEGTFKYHDHLSPFDRGTILVGKNNSTTSIKSLDTCHKIENSEQKITCFEILLENTFKKNGQKAIELFTKLVELEPNNCHQYAHDLGEYIADQYTNGKKMEIGNEASYCEFGFWHGFMAKIIKNSNFKTAINFCETRQDPTPRLLTELKGNCYHGLGIGLIPDPPKLKIWGKAQLLLNPALKECDNIKEEWRDFCYSGVFHPLINFMTGNKYSFNLDINHPFAICLNQEEKYKSQCYYQIAPKLAGLTKNNLPMTFSLIKQIPTIPELKYTFQLAIINFFNPQMSNKEYLTTLSECEKLGPLAKDYCISGLIKSFFSNGIADEAYTKGFNFCNLDDLNNDDKIPCFESVIKTLQRYYDSAKMKELCATIEKKYPSICNQ